MITCRKCDGTKVMYCGHMRSLTSREVMYYYQCVDCFHEFMRVEYSISNEQSLKPARKQTAFNGSPEAKSA